MTNTQSDLFRAGARMRTAESKLREGQIREAILTARVAELEGEASDARNGLALNGYESDSLSEMIAHMTNDGCVAVGFLEEQAEKLHAELEALRVADAHKTVAMVDFISAMGVCDEALEDDETYYCDYPGCEYCTLARATQEYCVGDHVARELLAKHEADNG